MSEGIVGVRKYEMLVSLDLENPTKKNIALLETYVKGVSVGEALKMIKDYEHKNWINFKSESAIAYFKELEKPEAPQKEKPLMTKDWLWKRFYKNYFINERVLYSKELDSLENIKPLIYYFIGDLDNFKQCENVSQVSEPSLSKGILIVGDYGNGKTSSMKAMGVSLRGSNVSFITKSTNDIVSQYEACANEFDKSEFWRYYNSGVINFDDLLTERYANNYGKVNIFKDVIEKRYEKNKRTYASINFDEKYPGNVEKALEQIAVKYGNRAYDRIYSMFNVVVFKGKSRRK